MAAGQEGAVWSRGDSYIGVMIDDLVTRGAPEPYRMFTSRAEYRLSLRADNADQRLTGRGIELGMVGSARAQAFAAKMAALAEGREKVARLAATPPELARHGLQVNADGVRRSAVDLLRYPGVDLARLSKIWPELADMPPAIVEQIEIDARYAGYLVRQEADIRALHRDESLALPATLDYAEIGSLSNEVRQVLTRSRPATLGAAAQSPG